MILVSDSIVYCSVTILHLALRSYISKIIYVGLRQHFISPSLALWLRQPITVAFRRLETRVAKAALQQVALCTTRGGMHGQGDSCDGRRIVVPHNLTLSAFS